MITTFERGRIADRRESLLFLLETKFGELSASVRRRVDEMTPEQLREAMVNLVVGHSLEQMGFLSDADDGDNVSKGE